jgi:hypothetical protein
VIWGDYDNDGDLDLLIAGLGKHDIPFTILYKNTGGTFAGSVVVLHGLSRATAAWGDFDGDGDLDLAMTGLDISGIPVTKVYRNDGGGVVTSVPHPFPSCYVGSAAWGNYNGDDKLDLAITGATTTDGLVAAIFRNEGGGGFTDIGANLPGMDLGFVAWGDYDNDGDLDLLFSGNSNDGFVTRIYRFWRRAGGFIGEPANSLNGEYAMTLPTILPLLRGEGRGEGERFL